MSQNPLQQFFRQPKIFIQLPSHGIFTLPGVIQGDVENLPIYGMTGMDEILLKTPDSLLTGESIVRAIESCCPNIKNAKEISLIDINVLLIAIRIATFGNELTVTNTCTSCNTENDYGINLSNLLDYYKSCQYNNKLVLSSMVINTKPLTYKESTDFSLKNFELQQKLKQINQIEDEIEKRSFMLSLFEELGTIQHEVYVKCIDTIKIGQQTVVEKPFIEEWIKNCDKETSDQLKNHFQSIQSVWNSPSQQVECTECNLINTVSIDFDQANFFGTA